MGKSAGKMHGAGALEKLRNNANLCSETQLPPYKNRQFKGGPIALPTFLPVALD